MKSFLIYTFSILILVMGGCSKDKIPGVYRIDIQQGNSVSQEMINQLKPGMTKKQVAYIMSTPLIIDTFHPNRWDYLYSYQVGGEDREQRRITLFFTDEDETLFRVEGDFNIVAREDLPVIEKQDVNVVVPLKNKDTGFFYSVRDTLGYDDDDQYGTKEQEKAENAADFEQDAKEMAAEAEQVGGEAKEATAEE